MCVFFSESVIRNHRGPVWRAVTTYLLLAEFSVRTVNYGPSFFPSIIRARAINRQEKKKRIRNLQYGPKKRG